VLETAGEIRYNHRSHPEVLRMNTPKLRLLLLPVCLAAAWTFAAAAEPVCRRLANGLEVVILTDNTNPAIASFVVVKTGLRGEGMSSSGISHMLEHLLFNGTATRTQEQIYEEADLMGAYHNAFTRDDYTCYMMLAPREHFPKMLNLQVDMVFHSILPPEKLEKERGIVLEELARDRTSPRYAAERALAGHVFAGSPYALPALGTEASIATMSREQILRYYRSYYVPNNAVLLLVGDVDIPTALDHVERELGALPRGELPGGPAMPALFGPDRFAAFDVDGAASQVVVTLSAPALTEPAWTVFRLVRRWLEDEEMSPLAALVRAGAVKGFQGETLTNRDYSLYQITLELPGPGPVSPERARALADKLRALPLDHLPEPVVRAYITQETVSEIYDMENIHYVGMWKGQILALADPARYPDYFGDRAIAPLVRFDATAVRTETARLLGHPNPIITVLAAKPAAKSPAPMMPPGAGMPR